MAFYLHIFPCLWLEFWFIVLYGEGCLDLKEEIGLVPATTYHELDNLDLVVNALQQAVCIGNFALVRMPRVTLYISGKTLKRLQNACFASTASDTPHTKT